MHLGEADRRQNVASVNQSVQVARLLIEFQKRLVCQVFVRRRLGRHDHLEAGAETVLAEVGQLCLKLLQVHGVANELHVDFHHELVAFK